jgi:hypothetical protein
VVVFCVALGQQLGVTADLTVGHHPQLRSEVTVMPMSERGR